MNNLIKQIVESKFNFNIDTEGNEKENSLTKTKYNSKSQKQILDEIVQYLVDLKLPSGTKWCRYNLGVNFNQLKNPKDWYGNYYAWGELNTKEEYTFKTYEHCDHGQNDRYGNPTYELTKYCTDSTWLRTDGYGQSDGLEELQLEDDVAYQNFHLYYMKFKYPSYSQLVELRDHTTNEWVENYKDIKKLNGRLFKSKNNDEELFIPASGFYKNLSLCMERKLACIWAGSLNPFTPQESYCIISDNKSVKRHGYEEHTKRCFGLPVRPVLFEN